MTWSYAELLAVSSKLSAALVAAGVRPGDRVGVCLRKSPEAVAAIFGIFGAGAVFVPLDRAAPAPRLVATLVDCGASALIGSGRKLAAISDLRTDTSAPLIEVPESGAKRCARAIGWDEALSAAPSRVASPRDPGDPAYILYTSGSTGTPKGVAISHANALAFTSWARREFEVHSYDRVLSVAPFHFDLSTFDLYSTIEGGGTIVLVGEDVTYFPASLAKTIESSRPTIAYLVPSVITGMLLHGDLPSRRLDTLRILLFAGEVFPPKHLSSLAAAFPDLRLVNLYGPTETNVCSWHEVRAEDLESGRPLPIGLPASGDRLFAIDDDGRTVTEPDLQGDLHVSGPTVALGYWNDPERSGASFLPGHAEAPSGGRVYRTGDLVSMDAAGKWLFHGRRDHMVKSRGYRIELGDIEAAVQTCEEVAEAAAVAVPDEEVGHRIKVCITPATGATLDASAVLKTCAERLPRWMVPESVEILDTLPRTSSGKIDRVQLASTGLAGAKP